MKIFDLKKFRGSTGLNQEEFAKRIKRSQTTVSRIEKGEKALSDKFLDAISKGFSIDLEVYKSYNQKFVHTPTLSQESLHDSSDVNIHNNKLSEKHDIIDLEHRYYQLLEEKARVETEHYALIEKLQQLEPAIMVENNELLKKLTAQNDLILNLLAGTEKK
ncbi:MAG: helix-turn-helix transcriptional regulator [Bacteroidetes bacterium]|nr:helix-turn-helix transcriptional regulator [Bacteroidota bacterium]